MVKNTITGSVLAKMFPTLYKHFSENASQEEFNKAEQEAAVVFQNQNLNGVTEPAKVGAELTALFPATGTALTTKLSAEELTAFTAEVTEVQKRLAAQVDGNKAVANDLTNTKAELTKAQGELTTANTTIAGLQPKANQWDAHQTALKGASLADDSTNTKGKGKSADTGLSAKDQANLDEKQRLSAKYPGLMAGIEVPTAE